MRKKIRKGSFIKKKAEATEESYP